MAKVELAVDVHCRTGEGPVSYPNGTLLFVDIEGCTIHEYDTVAKKHVRALPTNGKMPGNVVPCCSSNLKNYDLIASLDMSVVPMSFFGNDIFTEGSAIAKVYEAPAPIRFNDGKVDPEGRLWTGTMALDPDNNRNAGSLYCLKRGEGAEYDFVEKVNQVGISNGTDWIGDHMYYIDSLTYEVAVYDYEASDGSISNRRPIIKVPESGGIPDGLTVDASGKLWVAIYGGSKIVQIDPETGKELMKVEMPALCTTSMCFAGKDLSELYVTSGADGAKKQGGTGPNEGATFCVHIPGVKGSYFSRAFTQ